MIRKKRTDYVPAKKFQIGSLESRAAARHMLEAEKKYFAIIVCSTEEQGTGRRPDLKRASLLSRYEHDGDQWMTIQLGDGDAALLTDNELITWANATTPATSSQSGDAEPANDAALDGSNRNNFEAE